MANYENQESGLKRAGIENDDYTGQMAGGAQLGVKPMPETQMRHLDDVLNNTIGRYRSAINNYKCMNNNLIGFGPDVDEEAKNPILDGMINEVIRKAEMLHDLCADLDAENNRLNKVIDGS